MFLFGYPVYKNITELPDKLEDKQKFVDAKILEFAKVENCSSVNFLANLESRKAEFIRLFISKYNSIPTNITRNHPLDSISNDDKLSDLIRNLNFNFDIVQTVGNQSAPLRYITLVLINALKALPDNPKTIN
jgi:hypothetical protein